MEPLLSTQEACEILKMSRSAIYRYVKAKQIPAFIYGRRIKFPKAALLKWIGDRMEESNKTIKQ